MGFVDMKFSSSFVLCSFGKVLIRGSGMFTCLDYIIAQQEGQFLVSLEHAFSILYKV